MREWWWLKMTKFCVEDILIEELKEQDLNVNNLLQEYTKDCSKLEIERRVIYYEISDKLLAELKVVGIDSEKDLIKSIQAAVHDMGGGEIKIIRRKEE